MQIRFAILRDVFCAVGSFLLPLLFFIGAFWLSLQSDAKPDVQAMGRLAYFGQDFFDYISIRYEDFDILGVAFHTFFCSIPAVFGAAILFQGTTPLTDSALTIETLAGVQNPKISGFSVWDSSGDLSNEFAVGTLTDDITLA